MENRKEEAEEDLKCQYFADVEFHYNGTERTFDCRSFELVMYPKYCIDDGLYVKRPRLAD
jgi:hypothetical protein